MLLVSSPVLTSSNPPPEIISAILSKLPKVHRDPYSLQRTLASISLLNKNWYSASVQTLYDAPVLRSLDACKKFVRTVGLARGGGGGSGRREAESRREAVKGEEIGWGDYEIGSDWVPARWNESMNLQWTVLDQWGNTAGNGGEEAEDQNVPDEEEEEDEDEEVEMDKAKDRAEEVSRRDGATTSAAAAGSRWDSERGGGGLGSYVRVLDLSGLRFVSTFELKALAQHLGPRLRHLDLRNCFQVTDSAVSSLITHSHGALTHISIGDNLHLTDTSLTHLARTCSATLKSLHLQRLPRVTNETIYALARHAHALVDLQLIQMRSLTDKAATRWARKRPGQLTTLSLSRCGFTNEGVPALAKGCGEGLKCLSLAMSHSLTETSLFAFARWCKGLERVTISSTDVREYSITITDLLFIAQSLPALTHLCIYGSVDLTRQDVYDIARAVPQLTVLKVLPDDEMTEVFEMEFNAAGGPLRLVLDVGE
ncbi:hypothetical protein HK104_010614 [Borealophlyctis nickersoniae]|nr:hypothetical protein HK104_010614 [Borealophlyctis nickersoniae]